MFVLLCCRLLLFPTIPVIPVPSLLLRAGLPVEVGTEVFLSLIELPIREDMLELIRLPELPACGFVVLRTLGFLVLIMLPIRELLLELIRFLELITCGCVLRTLGLLVLIMLPIRELLLELIRFLELPACGCVLRTLGLLVLIELPIREDLLELMRLPELADVCLPAPELTAVGFLLPIEMLEGLRVPEVIPGRLVTGGLTVILPG